jgi:acetyltransferase-like isoleucine patch superfamily enzyme
MKPLETAISRAIEHLRKKGKLTGMRLSQSHQDNSGIDLSSSSEQEVARYVSGLVNVAYLHGVEPAKDSWHQINGLLRPIVNATVIELGKVLPYIPGIDKNHLYRAIGIRIGDNTTIAPRVQFDYFHPELIEIGNNCLVGDGAKFWTHNYGLKHFATGNIRVGRNVFIGSETVIGPATSIGDDAHVNFGAFLYGINVPAGAVVKGRPRSEYKR